VGNFEKGGVEKIWKVEVGVGHFTSDFATLPNTFVGNGNAIGLIGATWSPARTG